MTHRSEIKSRFRERLQAADARNNDMRQRLLDQGTRALQPVVGVLTSMAEVLDEENNVHGRIVGLEAEIDQENFVCLCARLQSNADHEQKIKIKYGPELGGSNFISVSGLNQKYNERLSVSHQSSVPTLGRSVGSDLHLDENRGDALAEVVREIVEEFYTGQAGQQSRFAHLQ